MAAFATRAAARWLRSSRLPWQRWQCQAVGEAEAAPGTTGTGNGLVLVTGGTVGSGHVFVKHALDGRGVFHIARSPTTSEDVDDILERAAADHPGEQITGLVHFGGCSAPTSTHDSASELVSTEAAVALRERLSSLTLLIARLVPAMRASGGHCRILTVSSEAALRSPSSWQRGEGMRSLSSSFLEQYTEALAHELMGTRITVFGIRLPEASEKDSLVGETAARFSEQLCRVWNMPSAEVHGQIIPLGRPAVELTSNSARGGSVIGPSIDVRWALRMAAGRAADYPTDGRPSAYSELAAALGTSEDCLVWCHGASDVIVRVTAAANARGHSSAESEARAVLQEPTWPNVLTLIRGGGISSVSSIPYPDPWSGEEASRRFWAALEQTLLGDSPPSLVYLVHPHFPTGVKEPDFGARLALLMERTLLSNVLVAVDQTYLGFTELTEDDKALEDLADKCDNVVLIRSLSKVEGLAAVRLGYARATKSTAKELADSLPFAGGLYVSELALAGAVAAVCGDATVQHRQSVLSFYSQERAWLCDRLRSLGLEAFPEEAPYLAIRGPEAVLQAAVEAGAAVQRFNYAEEKPDSNRRPAVVLVADRASNILTLQKLEEAMSGKDRGQGWPDWAEGLLKPFGGG